MYVQIRPLLLLLTAWILPAEGNSLVALHPFVPPASAACTPGLADLWVDNADNDSSGSTSFRIEPFGTCQFAVVLEGRLFAILSLTQMGGEMVADLAVSAESPLLTAIYPHLLLRMQPEGDKMSVQILGTEALFRGMAAKGSPRYKQLAGETGDVRYTVLTASTSDLDQFVAECLRQPDAFKTPSRFYRAGPKHRAADLNERSWAVSTLHSYSAVAGASLREAEEAIRLVPDNGDYWSTLAAARYRAGQYREALSAIGRAAKLRNGAKPEDLAYRAMIHKMLGESAAAQRHLSELATPLRDLSLREDPLGRLVAEAEELVVSKRKMRNR
jgi:hypothetical protein